MGGKLEIIHIVLVCLRKLRGRPRGKATIGPWLWIATRVDQMLLGTPKQQASLGFPFRAIPKTVPSNKTRRLPRKSQLFAYEGVARSTLLQLRLESRNFLSTKLVRKYTPVALARKQQLFMHEVHSKVATFEYGSSARSTLPQTPLPFSTRFRL